MKLQIQSQEKGFATVLVLCLVTLCLIIVTSTFLRISSTVGINERNNEYHRGFNAAEAATEKVLARVRYDYLNSGLPGVNANLGIYAGIIPTASDNPIFGNYAFSDGNGNNNKTYVACISNVVYGPLQSSFSGLYAWYPVYRIVSNARDTTARFPLTSAVQQDLTLASVPIFQFAIYYNGLLEFTWTAPFTVNGRVHANGSIYTGSQSALIFNAPVTTAGSLSSPAWFGKTTSQYTSAAQYNGNPTYTTNVPVVTLPLGTNNVHSIIDIPPVGESVTSTLGTQRLYNQAKLTILVNDTNVVFSAQNGANGNPAITDLSPIVISSGTSATALATNLPFVNLSTSFTDQREGNTVLVAQLDVGRMSSWLATNASVQSKFPSISGSYPNIVYIANKKTYNAATQMPGVRLVNAQTLPSNGGTGLSIVSPDPVYIQGYYNCPTANLGSTNTSATAPSSIMCDAITILSPAWSDANSANGINITAANDTVNTAIIAGNVPSTANSTTAFSGGVQNLTRLLESWSSATLTLNTSLVNLYPSQIANSQFQAPGIYYNAPAQRNFNFDVNFANPNRQPPPGTPNLMLLIRSGWDTPPPNTVNYTGQ